MKYNFCCFIFIFQIISFSQEKPYQLVNQVWEDVDIADSDKSIIWIKKKGKWGIFFKDSRKVINPIWDLHKNFGTLNGAWVKNKGKWGMIDLEGKLVLPFRFDSPGIGSKEGMVWLKVGEAYILANEKGESVSSNLWDQVKPFSNGVAWVTSKAKGNYWGLIDGNGQELSKFEFIEPNFKKVWNNKLYAVCKEFRAIHFLNLKTREKVKGYWTSFLPLENGVMVLLPNEIRGRRKALFSDGKLLDIKQSVGQFFYLGLDDALYDWVGNKVREKQEVGRIEFLQNDTFTLITSRDEKGQNQADLFNDKKHIFTSQKIKETRAKGYLSFTFQENKKWGAIDSNGEIVLNAEFDSLLVYQDGFTMVKKDGKEGLISPTGKTVLTSEWNDITYYSGSSHIWASKVRGKYNVFDLEGNLLLENIEASKIKRFKNGIGWIKKGSFWEMVSAKGESTIKGAWDDIKAHENDFSVVKKGLKFGVVDNKGKLIIPLKYESIFPIRGGRLFSVKAGSKYGVYNIIGKQLFKTVLDSAGDSYKSIFVKVTYKGKVGLLDNTGKVVLKPILSDIYGHSGFDLLKLVEDKGYMLITKDE